MLQMGEVEEKTPAAGAVTQQIPDQIPETEVTSGSPKHRFQCFRHVN